jgi:hypothetical protein
MRTTAKTATFPAKADACKAALSLKLLGWRVEIHGRGPAAWEVVAVLVVRR